MIQEGGGDVAASRNYLAKPLELLEGGFVAAPNGPWLGVELDEAAKLEELRETGVLRILTR